MFIVVLTEEDEGPVTLTCNTTIGRNVMWKFKGANLEETAIGGLVRQDGQQLILSSVEYPMLGEYSCWSEGHMLSSVYLLFEINKPGETFFLILHSFYHSVNVTCHCIVLLVS